MNFSRFFIDRPIFAGVLASVILLMGVIAAFKLPIAEYPEVIPPQVLVHAEFPGANPKVIAETVSAPIEEKINGVESMLYMQSQASSDGQMTTTVTFKLGMDPNLAQQLVQNRVSQALPRLPEAVQKLGVTTIKASSTMTLAVTLHSPDNRYDIDYLHNYALIHVRDRLARIQGVGDVQLKGGGDYAMRVWLDPNKLAERHLTTGDVVKAIQAQNASVSAGMVGASPAGPNVELQMNVNVKGRLQSPEEFEQIVVKTNADGGVTYLRDLARIELGAADYTQNTHLNTHNSMSLWIYQQPGANALQIADEVQKAMAEIREEMPQGLEYDTVYDPTRFVAESIDAVIHTLLEAIALVVLVIILFLQNWRATLIPLLSVPVAIIGTFSVMLGLGFSINALSLFGMVLAIGIVVDDAIVVVENVERNLEHGLSPREATYKAMEEVSKPIIAICLTLAAVFVPLAFMSGLTGQFYQQFAMTIAISTMISAFNSLALSPALAALMLRAPDAPKDRLTRVIDRLFGRFFGAFNRLFKRGSERYGTGVAGTIRRKSGVVLVYALLLALAAWVGNVVPGGFVPAQDKQYLIAVAQLPNGASLDRSTDISQEMAEMALKEPGIVNAVEHAGLSINGFTASSSSAVLFLVLDKFDARYGFGKNLSADAIAASMNEKFKQIKGAKIAVFSPPPVLGLGTLGGFKLQIEDRGAQGYEALNSATQAFIAAAAKAPELGPLFSSYEINVPQLDVEVDRVKAQQLGVPLNEVFDTLQVYLGSLYVNDINRFGRVFQVRVQADSKFRAFAHDITQLKARSVNGEMVPLGSVLKVTPAHGPEMVVRYNGFTASDLNGGPAAGYSMNQAQAAIERIAKETLPPGFKFEWTDLAYQQQLAGNAALLVFPVCVLLVFLVLAAQYESLTLPLAVILIVPMSLLSALTGVWLTGGDNNILTQIGLVVLVGLSAKNAILIVEFARELELAGKGIIEAAIEASRLRLRPILMTSLAFIMGVVPMVLATGPGSEMRQAIGISVFFGMLGVTMFGLMLTPVFYVLMRKLGGNRPLAGNQHAQQTMIEA